MKFIFYFYVLIIFLIQKTWKIQCSADFNVAELEHLSRKLHPTECMKLLESIYLRTPAYVVEDEKNRNSGIQLTQENCQLKLEQWNRMFPGNKNEQARSHVIKSLIHIGRTDLANFIKRNKRLIHIMNNFIKPGDLYLYNKYLPKRYSKRLLYQLNSEKVKNDDAIIKKPRLMKEQLMMNNSNSKLIAERHLVKKELTNVKDTKFKEVSSASQNKFQPIVSNVSRKPRANELPETHWLIIIGVLLGVLVILMILSVIFHYKTGKRILNAFISKGRCDSRCKGYERFPKETESEWITSSTDITPRRWQKSSSVPSLSLSAISTPEKKPSKVQSKKAKKTVDEKKKLEKELHKLTEKDKKKKEKKSSKEKEKSLEESDGMRMNIVNDLLHILPKDCTCCKCSVTKGSRMCMDDACCTQRRIKNIVSLCSTRPRKSSIIQRSSVTRRKESKAKLKKEKEHRRRASSTETLTRGVKESKLTSPRTCIRESIFESPRRRESSLREKPSPREKLWPKQKSPKKSSMEPCTNDTCGGKTSI